MVIATFQPTAVDNRRPALGCAEAGKGGPGREPPTVRPADVEQALLGQLFCQSEKKPQ